MTLQFPDMDGRSQPVPIPTFGLSGYKGQMTPAGPLLAALDAAYEAFSGYLRPQQLEATPTRDATKILATLSSAPLGSLSGEQIGPYAGWALTTVGSVEDYKHFLPRILEQAVRAPEWMGTKPSVVASRLNMAKWRTWPKPESAAVIEVFVAALRDSICRHPDDGCDASEWLCALASIGEDVQPHLRDWLDGGKGNSLLQIADLATQLPGLASLDAHEQAIWADLTPKVRNDIITWLTSADVGAALTEATWINANDAWRIKRGSKAIGDFRALTRH